MTVVYSGEAVSDLAEIHGWNVRTFGNEHADEYVAFVKAEIDALAGHHSFGRPVPGRAGLQYAVVIRHRQRHGHIVVYTVAGDTLRIVHVFGSAQDWQGRLAP